MKKAAFWYLPSICFSCGLFFTRTTQSIGARTILFKLWRGTFTGKEAVEFENFQKSMLSRPKFCIPLSFIKSLPQSIYNLFNKSVKKAIFTESMIPKQKRGYFPRPQQLQTQFPDLMDLEAPRIPVVSSKEATDVSLMRPQKPIDLPESFHECPAACEDKQKASTPMKSCNSLWSRSLTIRTWGLIPVLGCTSRR